jgi:hypothetical protein
MQWIGYDESLTDDIRSYGKNMGGWWKRKLVNEKVNHGVDAFHDVLCVQHGDGWVIQKNVHDSVTDEGWKKVQITKEYEKNKW